MKILFAGDVMLGRMVNAKLARRPPDAPWGDTLTYFREADARICNLECVISDMGRPWSATPKVFHFRTDSKNVAVLKAARIDAVTIANNHSLDYEYDALIDMISTLDSNGIAHAGAGKDLAEASAPALFKIKDKAAAMIAFTDNEPSWEAGARKPGVYYVPVDSEDSRAKRLFESVAYLRKTADIVIASAHWGPNWGYRPVVSHQPFARKLIESGADIVFGHSCHVFQGVEFYGKGVVLYGTGDFIDDYAIDEIERNDESFIFEVSFDKAPRSVILRPTVVEDYGARLADFPRAELISAKMKTLCVELGSAAEWSEKKGVLRISPRQ